MDINAVCKRTNHNKNEQNSTKLKEGNQAYIYTHTEIPHSWFIEEGTYFLGTNPWTIEVRAFSGFVGKV